MAPGRRSAKAAGATRPLRRRAREARSSSRRCSSDIADELRVCAEEAFAPDRRAAPYRGRRRRASTAANDSPYGLQAGLFSHDVRVIYEAFERLEVGALIVNDVNSFRVDQMPYGGAKQSGLGREGMRYAIREMTEERLLVLDPR